MIRKIVLALAAAAAMAGSTAAQPAPAWVPGPPQQRPTAAVAVERLRALLPRSFEGGAVLTQARAEGETLILTVEIPADWPAEGRAAFVTGFFGGLCNRRPNPYFDNGISIRIDLATAGRSGTEQGDVVSRCPAA